MPGRRSGDHAGSRVLRKMWALPAILLSGALMLISSGPPAAAAPSGQHRGPSITTAPGELGSSAPSVAGTGDVLDLAVVATAVTVKLGYAPPTPAWTVVGPLDLYLLDAGPAPADRVPADAAWTPTDPQRGPPAIRQ
ncbi:hypothetical protein [Jiangella rhizosphaerae]|uniref:Uncharacterized protein n=1 Tax=Jiangella rhizosphaerae TaxID=2293569 RepID=A0A418KTY2_9ACTN|nr:hypothetical protein [Jiangella rhizosphaerae]RIQ31037.1 hypothetical protein DY240_07080 [Jiangella rhizosphaerae]